MKYKLTVVIIAVTIVVLAMLLSGCFLAPRPKLLPPTLSSPANGATNISTSVTLKWEGQTSNSNITYKVYFGTSTTPPYYQQTDKTQITVSGLSYSTTYYWRVAAVNKAGKVATSGIWHFTTMAIPAPSTPTLSVTSVSTDSVSLQWSKSTNATSITLYSATSNLFNPMATLCGSATSYIVKDLEPASVYEFFVVASNASGKATSNTVTATTQSIPAPPKPPLPSTPILKVTSISTNSISLQWSKSKNASAIDVYSATSNQFNQIASLSANATSYTLGDLKPSTVYNFFVVAINPSGRATSNTVVATTQNLPTPPTTAFTIYLTDKPLPLSNVSAVYVSLSDISVHATLNGTSTWYSMLSTPTTYNLVDLVGTAVSVATKSLPSSALITQIRLEVASATVVVGTQTFVAKVPSGKILLDVAPVTVSQSIDLYLDFDLSSSLKNLGNGNYQLSPVIHPVSGNMRGMVKGEVMLNSKPLANALVSLSTSATVVSETYTKMNGHFTFAAVVTGSYTLSVEASGISTFSTSVTVNKGVNDIGTINLTSTPVTYPPEAPVITSIKANKNVVTLTWTESSTNISTFKIWRKSVPTQAYTLIVSVNGSTTTYTDNVQLGKKYSYMVSAINSYGTAWSKPKSVITPPILTVAPLFRKIGEGQTFTFTVTATSVAGIEKIVGDFDTQSKPVNTWTGSLEFTSPSTSGIYTATFTAYDNSSDHNQTTVTATVDVNTSLPSISFTTIPATVGSGIPFQVSVKATAIGSGNTIQSITIGGSSATFTPLSSNTYIATVTLTRTGNDSTTIVATAVDSYENTGTASKNIYVDGEAPQLTMNFIGTGVSAATSTYNFDVNNTNMSTTIYTNSIATSTIYQFDNSDATLTVYDNYIVSTTAGSVSTSTSHYVLFPYPNPTYTSTVSITATVDGTETIKDEFGNVATYTYDIHIIVDPTPPTMTIDAPATVAASKSFTATITVNDTGGSGLATSTFIATYNGSTVPAASYTYNSGKFVLTLESSSITGNSTLSARIEDKAGNSTSLTRTIYVDGTAPTITVKLSGSNIYFVNPTGSWSYSSSTSSSTTVKLYYGTSTPTIVGTVTDNSASNVTVNATYDNSAITISSNNSPQATFQNVLAAGQATLTVYATDAFGNQEMATVTFIATEDSAVSTVVINATPTGVNAASPTAYATYTVTDAQSGIQSAEITVESTSGSKESTSITFGTLQKVDLMPLLLDLPILNKGATDVYVTITATDNVGNVGTSSVATMNVNLTFSITNISTALTTDGATALILKFNTLASTNSSFVASDITLTYTASNITYYASTLVINGTTNVATITVFASGTANGSEVLAGGLPTGNYTVSATNVVSKNNNISVSNNGTSLSL